MIRFLHADQLSQFPALARGMFRDRARQFHDRLGWDVTVDENGEERDQYDDLNPLYVIWERADGTHGGSMRFLPTTGRTMVNEHFLDLTDGVEIRSPLIWECTRFFLAPDAEGRIAGALMLAGGEIMENFGVDHFVAVFEARMLRVYRLIGASPDVLGMKGEGASAIGVGLWEFTEASRARLAERCGIPPELTRNWFQRSFYGASLAPAALSA
jgi:acyl homoserine lactone synthase